MSEQKEPQSKNMMMILCFFFGSWGLHRMMMGYSDWWKRLLLFFFCLPVGAVLKWIDLYKIYSDSLKMADGRDLLK